MLSNTGTPVHFPSNPASFQFDGEVAQVFPDMAARSIPNFHAAHLAHVGMASAILAAPGCRVLDIGASRGAFFSHIHGMGFKPRMVAVDSSPEMCDFLRRDFPEANVLCRDITNPGFLSVLGEPNPTFDIVCCNYVLQFLPIADQERVLRHICGLVAPGGMLFFGHKAKYYGALGVAQHVEYIKFRLRNGYTHEEIEAKTKALQGSMFPMDHRMVLRVMREYFQEVEETTRFMMFSTIAARK